MSDSHAHGHDDHGGHDHGLAHVLPIWLLVGVWATLMALTGITVWSAQYDLGRLDLPVAMGIATVKALLVALVFMHLLWDKKFHGMLFMASLVFAGLFVTFSMMDVDQNMPDVEDRLLDEADIPN
jgi:cytochrome c oxidase subunit 4